MADPITAKINRRLNKTQYQKCYIMAYFVIIISFFHLPASPAKVSIICSVIEASVKYLDEHDGGSSLTRSSSFFVLAFFPLKVGWPSNFCSFAHFVSPEVRNKLKQKIVLANRAVLGFLSGRWGFSGIPREGKLTYQSDTINLKWGRICTSSKRCSLVIG